MRNPISKQKVPNIQPFLEVTVCAKTVANALKMEGFKSAPKVKKPLLSKKHRQARLEFAKRHQYWTVDD
jgi:hypothetical protein